MRLWVRLGRRINLSPRFSWTIVATPDTPENEVLFQSFERFSRQTDSTLISVFVLMTVKKNRELFRGAALASRGSFALPQVKYPYPSTGILTGFPFAIRPILEHAERVAEASLDTELPYSLGATHPRRNALHAEPFLTSVYKVLICIIATITKICTRGFSSQAHAQRSTKPPRPSTRAHVPLVRTMRYK